MKLSYCDFSSEPPSIDSHIVTGVDIDNGNITIYGIVDGKEVTCTQKLSAVKHDVKIFG